MAQVGSTCYSSDAAAVSAIAAREVGHLVGPWGGDFYVIDAIPSSDSSITYTLNSVSGAPPIIYEAPVTIQPCQQIDWQDGLALSWAIAGAWIAAAVIMSLKQAAHS